MSIPYERGAPCGRSGTSAFAVLPFASGYAYSPSGRGPLCEEARALCADVKAADPYRLARAASEVWMEAAGHGRFAMTFGAAVVLVPVPGSGCGQSGAWVGERLAWCLKELGLAAQVWPILEREYAVRKSAFASAGERPSVSEHYASFAIERGRPARTSGARGECIRLTLVDDVITRGRTLMAAAQRLRLAFPAASIRAFALLRTLGREQRLDRILDPCEGEVRWVAGDARRIP
jgi:hypothetical protein